jgi:hypothetical protein
MHGLAVYVGMHGIVVLLQYAATPAILLLAILHVAQLHFGAGLSWIYASPILTFVLASWAVSEIAFWVYTQCRLVSYRKANHEITRSSPAERLQLFQRCLAAVHPDRQHMERFLSGWFPNARFTDLCRGNVEQWCD